MLIRYKFSDGTISEVDVNEEIGTFILNSRRLERNYAERERYHCPYSYDAIDFEGLEYADPNGTDELFFKGEEKKRIQTALYKLTEVQRKRLLMLADGLSIREIARLEKVDHRAVRDSIEAARKKFINFF